MDENTAQDLVQQILRRTGSSVEFELSAYINGPPGVTAHRRLLRLRDQQLVRQIADGIETLLLAGEELGLNSRCREDGRVRHIPMIDMTGKPAISVLRGRLARLGKAYDCEPILLDSGRSYHCYFPVLLTKLAWQRYMGSLLLSTPPVSSAEEIPVDVRWVGHSLCNGFSCLRWTARTEKYVRSPAILPE